MNETKTTHSVSFGEVIIREYPIVLGDNPSCHAGVPLQIDWTPISSNSYDLESYEITRAGQRRTKHHDLIIPVQIRAAILLKAGFNIHDIATANEEVEEIQRSRDQNAQSGSWDRFHSIMETTGDTIKRAKLMRKKGLFTLRNIVSRPRLTSARTA